MAAKDPAARTRAATIAAHWSWAMTADRAARTRPARQAALKRLEQQVDPDNAMTPQARAKAVEHAKAAKARQMAERRWAKHRAAKAA